MCPIYSYECEDCGLAKDEYRSVAKRNDSPLCCGSPMKKVISGYRVIGDLEPYYDENLESFIKSKRHRQQVMREKDVYESYGKGWR